MPSALFEPRLLWAAVAVLNSAESGAFTPSVRQRLPALVSAAIGAAWLAAGWSSGLGPGLGAMLPGAALLILASVHLLIGGSRRVVYYLALVAPASLALALILMPWLGGGVALALAVASALGFVAAGWSACAAQRLSSAIGQPATTPRIAAKAAFDSALMGFYVACARTPSAAAIADEIAELETLETIGEGRGWKCGPSAANAAPEPPAEAYLERAHASGLDFDWLTFTAGFTTDPELPGASRWADHTATQIMAARVFEHGDGPRPWLVCVHGYRMGTPCQDLAIFQVRRLHHKLGLNLLQPILPLHGVRRATRLTGGLFFDGPMANLLHAESQTLWDLRRCLAWLRQHAPNPTVGVLGASLGGYNAALLAAVEPDLSPVIAAVPLVDIPAVLWLHMRPNVRRTFHAAGFGAERLSRILAPVSPLAGQVASNGAQRFIVGATADQIVPPEQSLALWQHWQQPPIHWYHGSHLSIRREPGVWPFIDDGLRAGGLVDSETLAKAAAH